MGILPSDLSRWLAPLYTSAVPPEQKPMSRTAISARVRRLNQLALGVAREVQLVGQDDLLLYVERREYLTALHRMCTGLDGARVALAKARRA
jgi:hypothetical protein